jgi:amidase
MRVMWAAAAVAMMTTPVAAQRRVNVEELSLADLGAQLAKRTTTSEAATRAYLARIAAIDRKGPTLRSVIAINPQAIAQARSLDAERKAGRVRGPLHGVPILVKDNIETAELPTTAGSLALKDNLTRRDAPVIARLRAAGAVILGKTNLSEWANIRSTRSMSGWSAVGGQVRNPYALDRTPCGSSSGTGSAIATSLAAGGLGTETNGSVVCPASINGLVGLKPTVGAVSRTHIVPISHSQDTAGPMTRSVRDAAILFGAMIGSDPADAATTEADAHKLDYAAGLSAGALRGKRIAVLRQDVSPDLDALYTAALAKLRKAGAELVDVKVPRADLGDAPLTILLAELKADLNSYLADAAPAVRARTLAQIIAFNEVQRAAEMPYFAQDLFVRAEATKGLNDAAYLAALAKAQKASRDAIAAILAEAKADIYVAPTTGPGWLIDPVHGDSYEGPSASSLPAIAGYPHLTVPMGLIDSLPAGLSFIGRPWTEQQLLAAGYAFEQAARARVAPRYLSTADAGPGMDGVR